MSAHVRPMRRSVHLKRKKPRHLLPSLARRLAAGLVDFCVAGMFTFIFIFLDIIRLDRWIKPSPELPFIEHFSLSFYAEPWALFWTIFWCFIPIIVVQIALTIFPGKTLGGWLFKLELMDRSGRKAGIERQFIRAIAYLLWPLTLGWAPLFVLISRRQQGLHDAIAGIVVVRKE